jgi:2-isopropylmalate synthase
MARLAMLIDGKARTTKKEGNGPVDATFNAIKALVPENADVVLELYQVHAVTQGTDAQAIVTVRLERDGQTVSGQDADVDTLVASAKAYISALNRLESFAARRLHYSEAVA